MAARLFRQPSYRVECVEDSIRVVFAFLDIGLVERVNAEYMSRYGRCKLPPEEFRTDIVAVTEIELENRLIGFEERLNSLVERMVFLSFEFEIDDETVVPIGAWAQNRFLGDRNETGALFACTLTRTFSTRSPNVKVMVRQ